MEQGSPEWLAARCGCITASRVADLMARTKNGPSASRANLIALLAVERLTGQPEQTYANDAMRRGTELEPIARSAWEAANGMLVEECGFVLHPTLPRVGCSPDGLVGDSGLLEIKCPSSMAKHVDALRRGAHAVEYRWQIQMQMWVTGRTYCHMVSFDPRFPEPLQIAEGIVVASEADQQALHDECVRADAEIEAMVEELRGMM